MSQTKKAGDFDGIDRLMQEEGLNTKSAIFGATKDVMDKIMQSVYTSDDEEEIDAALKQREELIQYTVEQIEESTGKEIKF
jgi:hypothetical protein